MTFKNAPREVRDGQLKIERDARMDLARQIIEKRKTLLERLDRQ